MLPYLSFHGYRPVGILADQRTIDLEDQTMCTHASLAYQPDHSFAERMLDILNHGALSVMISIGHRTGLFDAMASGEPATSSEIAATAGLDERYVREWLGAMTAGGIVACDPAQPAFALPAEHAAWLTRAAAPDNLAVYAQYVAQLGVVEDGILDCFRHGGGLPYSAYPRFHEIMAEDSGQTVLPVLLDQILPLVPGLTERLQAGADVLDIGCGRGRALLLLARAFPRSRFTGYDLSREAVDHASAEAAREGLTNVRFTARDLTDFDETAELAAFDLITSFDAIHDQKSPDRVLAGIARALRPGGVYLMQDIAGSSHVHENQDHPLGPFLYTVSCLHCMSVSLAQGGAGLGAMWGEQQARAMLAAAGFARIETHHLEHDVQNSYYVMTRD
jgi:2-polyprenyl-3-methyl-5-hydroxy-6-metoxy-1,4-benzoquinol methylase